MIQISLPIRRVARTAAAGALGLGLLVAAPALSQSALAGPPDGFWSGSSIAMKNVCSNSDGAYSEDFTREGYSVRVNTDCWYTDRSTGDDMHVYCYRVVGMRTVMEEISLFRDINLYCSYTDYSEIPDEPVEEPTQSHIGTLPADTTPTTGPGSTDMPMPSDSPPSDTPTDKPPTDPRSSETPPNMPPPSTVPPTFPPQPEPRPTPDPPEGKTKSEPINPDAGGVDPADLDVGPPKLERDEPPRP